VPNFFHSQSITSIEDLYKLDTIIDTKIPVKFEDFNEQHYVANIFKDILYIYCPSYNEDDTIRIKKINLINYQIENKSFFLEHMSDKVKTPFIKYFDVSNKYTVFYFTYENLIVYDNESGKKIIDTTISSPGYCPFEKIKILQDSLLIFSKTYNATGGCGSEVKIKIFNLKSKNFIKEQNIVNSDREFTHFSPYQWVTVSDKFNIAVSKSTEYKIYFFNNQLVEFDSIVINDTNWRKIPRSIIPTFYKTSKNQNPKDLIEFLRPHNEKYSRIERIQFLNDSLIQVIKIPYNQKIRNYPRYHDILVLRNNKWQRIYKDIFESPANAGIIKKNNLVLMTSNSLNNFFANGYYVNIKPSSISNFFNKTSFDIEKELELNGEKNLTYRILIYKYKM